MEACLNQAWSNMGVSQNSGPFVRSHSLLGSDSGALFGVLTTRVVVYWGLFIGPLIFGTSHTYMYVYIYIYLFIARVSVMQVQLASGSKQPEHQVQSTGSGTCTQYKTCVGPISST